MSPDIERVELSRGPAGPEPQLDALGALVPMRTPVPSRLSAAATAPTVAQGIQPPNDTGPPASRGARAERAGTTEETA